MMLGVGEIIMVLAVALMVLGPKRMPEMMRQVAKWLNHMRRITEDVKSQVEDALRDEGPSKPPPPSLVSAKTNPYAAPATDVTPPSEPDAQGPSVPPEGR